MELVKEKTVAEVVAENIKAAHVFKKYGIDFCCGGNISIEDACVKKGVDFSVLMDELENIDQVSKSYDYNKWELDFLIDHIINIHHNYVLENIPLLSQYATKVARVHGEEHPEVVKVKDLYLEVADELMSHMQKEEVILFPYIKELVNAKREGGISEAPHFGTVQNPVKMMEHEHETAGNIFKEIAMLTSNYTPPEGACNTFKALYSKLEEFEQDLHQHIHLENNILFPKAIILEGNFN
ncbi:iron-sulfur cluster repair protein ScdA [Flavobacteriaceae bacterium UJ101]|nr:iron-sulfur cluster repair protein ScdA [Flavobacteriaceae bacterium UJ101]